MFNQMSKFRENQIAAGQFAGVKTAGYAEYGCAFYKTCRGPGQNGGRINLFKTELGKYRPKGGQFFVKQRPDCLYGDIFGADAGSAGQDDHVRR